MKWHLLNFKVKTRVGGRGSELGEQAFALQVAQTFLQKVTKVTKVFGEMIKNGIRNFYRR